MKKILIITGTYLPGKNAGGPIESIKNLTNSLKDEFEFYIITTNRDFGEKKTYENIEVNQWYEQNNVKVKYYYKNDFSIFKIKKMLIENDYDLIYLQSIFCLRYTILPILTDKLFKLKNKILIAPRGNLDKGALSLKKYKKILFLKLAKILGIYKNVLWHATAKIEEENIKEIFGRAKIYKMSNLKENIKVIKKNTKKKNILRLIHISRIHPKKNLIFFLESLEKLDKKILKNIVLDIYGPIEDKEYWEKCKNIIKVSGMKCNYLGYVENKEVVPKISEYDFFVLPTLGENFGHVILESLIAHTPIIISKNTPWKNIEDKNIGYILDLNSYQKTEKIINECLELDWQKYQGFIERIKQYLKIDYNLQEEKEKVLICLNSIIEGKNE